MSLTDPAVPIPAGLATAEFVLRPITADDAADDHAALMETRQELRLWEQSSWPADDFTVEANREDLAGLQERHRAHRAFTYTVRDPGDTECLGCVYVFSTSAKFLAASTVTALGDDAWTDVDAVVFFWVRRSRVASGLDAHLLAALRAWFVQEWPVSRTVYVTNEQFTQQVGLFDDAGLLEVVAATFYAWLLLGESLTVLQLVGGALILGGIALVRVDASGDAVAEPVPAGPREAGLREPSRPRVPR